MSDFFIRPLTMTTEEGKPYTRSPAVTQQIKESLAWTDAELIGWRSSLSNEALLYHIRRFRDSNADIYGMLLREQGLRTVRIVKAELRGVGRLGKEDIARQVEVEILELAIATEPSRKSEFLEVAFTQAVRRRAINLREQFEGTVQAHRGRYKPGPIPEFEEEKKNKTRPLEFAPDSRNNAEAGLLAFHDEEFRDQAWQMVQAALEREDPRFLVAFRLTVVDGWPVWSPNPDVPTVARHFGLTRRQARYILEKTYEIINKVISAHSADKGDKRSPRQGD